MQQIDQVLIPVEKIDQGMFPAERAVTVRGTDGKAVTLFAGQYLIEERDQRPYLRVTRMEVDDATGISVCLFPDETWEGTRWIRVRTTQLQAA